MEHDRDMNPILALDLSTNTGWAYFESGGLHSVGTFTEKVVSYKSNIKSYEDIPECYPWNIIDTSNSIALKCNDLVTNFNYPFVVIEHTEGSSHRISQRTLEFIHFAILTKFAEHEAYHNTNKIRYLLNSDWRRLTRCYVSQWKDAIEWNKKVSKAKKSATPNKAGAKVAKIDGKVVSRIDAKKLSMKIAKELYPKFSDQITTDDISDAVNLGHSAIKLNIFNF